MVRMHNIFATYDKHNVIMGKHCDRFFLLLFRWVKMAFARSSKNLCVGEMLVQTCTDTLSYEPTDVLSEWWLC